MMGLRKRGRWHSSALAYWFFSIAIAATEVGCGSSDESPGGTGGSGGSGNNLGSGGSVSTPSCDGAFAKVPVPYSANTAFDNMSVFAVDEQGLVFSALPDDKLAEDTSDLPTLLMASDLQGNVSTLREADATFFNNLVFDGDDLIFTEGFIGRRLLRMSRKGGSETVLAENVREGAFADESSLYYFGSGDNGATVLFSLSRAGGLAKVLADRGRIGIRGFAFEGDTLYWGEEPPTLSNENVSIYRMKVDATEPTLIAEIPSDTAGSLAVSGGVVFSTLITDSFDIRTFRVDAGKAPFPLGETGVPFILADGRAYYGGYGGGLIRNTLNFDAPTTLSGTSGKSIYALATGPSDLWYATLGCVFRTPK
jgi:hypothetical protein